MQVNGNRTQRQPSMRLPDAEDSSIVDLTRGERLVPPMELDRAVAQALLAVEQTPSARTPQDDEVPDLVDDDNEGGKMWCVILAGATPGVFGPRMHFVPKPNTVGEKLVHCNTQAEAERLFDAALNRGLVERIQGASTQTMTRLEFPTGTYN
ncbi:hypothetical protein GALMADRAFT_144717 [Galerina marginata CBS 339.88]|uniref:Uncharacterized protein n=1 Tax=Galerina marginata (strain CBS 339.88) TaxID=685588 RepID=A0A067SK95_GALM3|nr:hypothetical protein GALMADRAFT_144717 [Galerina marginata CBS 339.88]